MHDPDVVAFEIPRPWPQRSAFSDDPSVRWRMRYHHGACDPETCGGCLGRTNSEMFPWYKASSYSSFWVIAGRRVYWPSMLVVWHHDPGNYDAFDVCKRKSHWRWHVHHWHIQIPGLQHLRRSLLTRCQWCKGKSRKGDYVNVSHQWDGPRGHWWEGEPGLYHGECSSVERAHRTCLCEQPILEHNDYGTCIRCLKFRAWRTTEEQLAPARLIVSRTKEGERMDAATSAEVNALWKALREKERS